ncbi:hypothetical protein HHK36_012830 [Tetracentron sinense]|uniref:NADP-dependent oxidoreductase domain-containing protein n=1 Tax=Tetracentron sinense TaxID=13715 RepID=A0A834Z9K1_TETSI|nr:hypothetical protein HHK36_012830 [Tetracentron sinense]
MTFGEQNTEKEAHEILNYAFEHGINTLDTAEAVSSFPQLKHSITCFSLHQGMFLNVFHMHLSLVLLSAMTYLVRRYLLQYPVPKRKETQGKTDLYIGSWLKSQPRNKIILATKVCGYSERLSYLCEDAKVLRVDAANIKESVEKSHKRLNTDYIDLLQIHWIILLFSAASVVQVLRNTLKEAVYDFWEVDLSPIYFTYIDSFPPDRYVALFGEFFFDPSKWRPSIPLVEQLKVFQKLIDEGKRLNYGPFILYGILVFSNETLYGVMQFVQAAQVEGLPKIVSIQNNYSLLVRCQFEGGGSLSGKYLGICSEAVKIGRLNRFPGYMERYNKSIVKEATELYNQLAAKHSLTLVQLALGFARDRPFVTSSIICATSVDQLKENIDAFVTTELPLPPEVMTGIDNLFKRFKDPVI